MSVNKIEKTHLGRKASRALPAYLHGTKTATSGFHISSTALEFLTPPSLSIPASSFTGASPQPNHVLTHSNSAHPWQAWPSPAHPHTHQPGLCPPLPSFTNPQHPHAHLSLRSSSLSVAQDHNHVSEEEEEEDPQPALSLPASPHASPR